MTNSLNELSGIYLSQISEQDNTPEEVKTRVMQIVKAIRYKARKEGGNLVKAFNDYIGSQSGVGSAERQMVKQRLGLSEDYETQKTDEVLGALKKKKKDFKKRYGKMGPDVMLQVAKDTVKRKGDTSKSDDRYAYEGFSNWREEVGTQVDYEKMKSKIGSKKKHDTPAVKEGLGVALGAIGGGALAAAGGVAAGAIKGAGSMAAAGQQAASKNVAQAKKERARQQVANKQAQDIKRAGGVVEQIEAAVEYLYEEGINEEGIDLLIEEIGLEGFVEFVEGSAVELNEERAARKASVRAKKFPQVKAAIDKADAARKAAKKGEYAPSYAKKETDVTVYDDKPAAKKKAPVKKTVAKKAPVKVAKKDYDGDGKIETPKAEHRGSRNKAITKAVAKVKKTQPSKKASKQGLTDKIRSAYKKGMERHKKAREAGRVPEKRAKEFGKGVVSGVKTAVKAAKDVKKAVVGEAQELPANIAAALSRLEKKRVRQGGDKKDSPYNAHRGKKLHPSQGKMVGPPPQKKVEEAKVDTGSPEAKASARNVRNTPPGKDYKFDTSVFITRKPGESLDSARTRKRREAHAKKRGVTERFSNWRDEIREIADDVPETDTKMAKKVKEKKVNNKIVVNPNMASEAKKLGGEILEMTEDSSRWVNESDKAFQTVVGNLRKKYKSGVLSTKQDFDNLKKQNASQPKRKPEKDTRSAAQREVDAQYGRTPWNKKGSLGT